MMVTTRRKWSIIPADLGDFIMDMTLRVVRIALELVAERAFSILAILMTFALSCWAMWEPTWERMAIAAFFAVTVYVPSLTRERKRKSENPDT